MDDPTIRLLVDAALAIGIGLCIGLEREQDVLAGTCGRDRLLGVQVVRCRDRDDVDLVGVEEVLVTRDEARVRNVDTRLF